jgi:peptide/nickel transport system permease protein
MLRYLAGRVIQAVLVLWAAFTVTFVILYVLPSDPVSLQLTAGGVDAKDLKPAELHALQHQYGLDQPIVEQYWHRLVGFLHFDFGQSFTQNVSVGSLLSDRLPSTIALGVASVLLVLVFGVGLAYLSSYVQWTPARSLLSRLPAVGISLPTFFVGLLLIQLFAFNLGWFPATGTDGVKSLVLPAITLAIPGSAILAQVLTKSLNDTWREPYIVTARAKGLSRWSIQLRHAFRNAGLPALTLLGLLVGYTVTNAVVVETVFSRAGLGQLAQQSVLSQDTPVVLAIVVVAAAIFVVVNLIVDLLYSLLDPRVVTTARVA